MFKCKECGTEYKEKPDYCDCGNDTFEEIKPAPEKVNPTPAATPKTAAQNSSIPKIQQMPKREYTSSFDQPANAPKIDNSADVISLTLFILCVGLALCTIFFIGNPETNPAEQETKTQTEQQTVANIPSVDSYWDNTAASTTPEVVEPQPEEKVNPLVQAVQTAQQTTDPVTAKFEQWLNKPPKQAENITIPQSTTQPKQTTTKPVIQTTKQTKPQQTTTVKSNPTKASTSNAKINSPGAPSDLISRVQNNIQYTNTNTTKTATQTKSSTGKITDPAPNYFATTKTSTTTATKTTTTTTQPQKTSQTTTAQKPPAIRTTTYPTKSQAELKQEVTSYKAGLSRSIGRKINFSNVVGDGSCSVTFRVDSSGRLVSKNFASKSSNITLNDAVFSAVQSTPSYNPPPEGYKNETMTLFVKIYNGNYEISIN